MQQLENNAIVGPDNHGRPRKILIQHNQSLPFFTKRSHKFDPVMMAMEDEQLKQTKGISDNRGCGCRSIVIGIILIYLLLILFALHQKYLCREVVAETVEKHSGRVRAQRITLAVAVFGL